MPTTARKGHAKVTPASFHFPMARKATHKKAPAQHPAQLPPLPRTRPSAPHTPHPAPHSHAQQPAPPVCARPTSGAVLAAAGWAATHPTHPTPHTSRARSLTTHGGKARSAGQGLSSHTARYRAPVPKVSERPRAFPMRSQCEPLRAWFTNVNTTAPRKITNVKTKAGRGYKCKLPHK